MLHAGRLTSRVELRRPGTGTVVSGVRRPGTPALVATAYAAVRMLSAREQAALGGERTGSVYEVRLRRPLPGAAAVRVGDTITVLAGPMTSAVLDVQQATADRDSITVLAGGAQAVEVR